MELLQPEEDKVQESTAEIIEEAMEEEKPADEVLDEIEEVQE